MVPFMWAGVRIFDASLDSFAQNTPKRKNTTNTSKQETTNHSEVEGVLGEDVGLGAQDDATGAARDFKSGKSQNLGQQRSNQGARLSIQSDSSGEK